MFPQAKTIRLITNHNSKPVLAKDFVVRDGHGNYAALSWNPRTWARGVDS